MNATLPKIARRRFESFIISKKPGESRIFAETDFVSLSDFNQAAVMVQVKQPHWNGLTAGNAIADFVRATALEKARSLTDSLRRKMSDLAALEQNWDGEGAQPVKESVLADVAEALRRLRQGALTFREPFLAPTFDGFVQIEWGGRQRSLDIEAVETGWSAVGTVISPQGKRGYETGEFERNDFARFRRCYDWLCSNDALWPLP